MSIEAEREPASKKIRVLLVEDHFLTRLGLKSVLISSPEIDVIAEAENGQEAVDRVNEVMPDVVLMDVGMPVMDGIEAAGCIRKSHPCVNIVMLTASDRDQDIFAALASGVGGYCLKDAAPERICRAIVSVNAGDVWLDQAIASRVMKLYTSNSVQTTSYGDNKPLNMSGTRRAVGEKPDLKELADPLSPREIEVLSLMVEGLSNQQISDRLVVTLATTKTHVRSILNKLAVDDRTQAAVHAMRRGLV